MYQALYRKWRPRTFDDVVGQEHITQTLKRQVAAGRTSHAYLFTGTRGTGKTSCAKILARAVNCEEPRDGNPCNECGSCRGIESGSILDVVELDAASNNRVDDMRAVLDEAVYTPAAVKKRVYIVDEVHMLTAQAFNALLQTLEEPPEHLMFILATTEVHKVPATIKSRCQQFSFKRIRPEAIAGRLEWVAEQEGLELSAGGAELLARLADGGMRDGLSLLDRCAGERKAIGEGEILETLGLAGNSEAAALFESAARGDTEGTLTRLDRLYAGGKEMSALLGELSALARDLLVYRAAPKNGAGLMTGGFDSGVLERLGKQLDTPRLLRMASALQRTAAGLTRSPNRRTDTELCLVSLCDPRMDDTPGGIAARVAALEEQLSGGASVPLARSAVPSAAVGEEERPPLPEEAPPPFDDGDAPPWEEPEAAMPRPAVQVSGKQAEVPNPPRVAVTVSWAALRGRLEQSMNVADFCFVGNPDMVTGTVEDKIVTLWAASEFVKGFIDKPDILKTVAEAAEALTGASCRAQVRVGTPPAEAASASGQPDALDALLGLENVTEV